MNLEPEQEEVLSTLVEASRNISNGERQPFLALRLYEGNNLIVSHEGLPGGKFDLYIGDFDVLDREQLISVRPISSGAAYEFEVLPSGYAYYRELKQRNTETLQTVETNLRQFLDGDRFCRTYPVAYQKLRDAETLLWVSDSNRKLTTIGHLCRETLQEFATELIEHHKPTSFDNDKSKTISRLRAVIGCYDKGISEAAQAHLKAIIAFWGTVNDLIQRQEHGGEKEGEPLIWEDARRAVFQTAVVMYEIDRSLANLR